MRLCSALALAISITTAGLAPVAVAPTAVAEVAGISADADPDDAAEPGVGRADQPYCGDPDSDDFPIATRLHGGPDRYVAGGEWQRWSLDLRNTTDAVCHRIHPVAVLVDKRRTLQPADIRFEFYDPADRRWRPVPFVVTDEDELIGVFDDGFDGFSASSRGTVTVKVRMAFSHDTPADRVSATVTTVQRREDDGDWIGESGEYRFSIAGSGDSVGPGDPQGRDREGNGNGNGDARPRLPGQLAKTGTGTALGTGPGTALGTGLGTGLGAAALALVLSGGALVLGARRIRR